MRYYVDGPILFVTEIEVLDLTTLKRLVAETNLLGMEQSTNCRLIDFTGVSRIDLDFHDLHSFAISRKDQEPAGRTAIIYNNPFTFGFIRMWMSLMDDYNDLLIEPFSSRNEALSWLKS